MEEYEIKNKELIRKIGQSHIPHIKEKVEQYNQVRPRVHPSLMQDEELFSYGRDCIKSGLWTLNLVLGYIQDNAISWSLAFDRRRPVREVPDRCALATQKLITIIETVLRDELHKERISHRKVSYVVVNIIKNVSRCKSHNTLAIECLGNHTHWNDPLINRDRLSSTLFTQIIDILIDKEYCIKFKGSGGDNLKDIPNMLLFSPKFIQWCCSSGDDSVVTPIYIKGDDIEPCMKPNIDTLIKVKDPHLTQKEIKSMDPKEEVLKRYYDMLCSSTIEVDGHVVPELYFTRIYNKNLTLGGRYYDHGEFLTKPKEVRSATLIDGQPVVSLDLKHLHPSILYDMVGVDLGSRDPYDVVVPCVLDTSEASGWCDKFDMKIFAKSKRNLAKLALLCMINSTDKTKCIGAVCKAIRDDKGRAIKTSGKFVGMSQVRVKEVVDNLIEANKEISQFFFSNMGMVLQNKDSDMIDYCIQKFMEEDEVLLPVHDCIVVKDTLEEFGRATLADAYEEVIGTRLNCIIEKE